VINKAMHVRRAMTTERAIAVDVLPGWRGQVCLADIQVTGRAHRRMLTIFF
jgi:hypothetical protein